MTDYMETDRSSSAAVATVGVANRDERRRSQHYLARRSTFAAGAFDELAEGPVVI